MLSSKEIDILGQITNTTWGNSSTAGGAATMSIKTKMSADKLTITFATFATFASNVAMSQQMSPLNSQGKQAVDQYLKVLKEEFKKESGRALKTKLLDASPSVEVTSLQTHVSPKRTVLFRYIALFEIE